MKWAYLSNRGHKTRKGRGVVFQSLAGRGETFEKCSILFKFKEGEDFNHRNTLSILRIEI